MSEESSPALTIPPLHTLNPIRVRELQLLRICRAECVRGILQSAKANSFEEEGVQGRDWLDSDQGKFNPEMSVLIASRTMHRVYYRAAPRLCFTVLGTLFILISVVLIITTPAEKTVAILSVQD